MSAFQVTALAETTAGQAAGITPGEILILTGAVIAVAFLYRVSLFLKPCTRCRRCGGSGKVGGFLGGWGWCRRCGGDGLVPRMGTVLLASRRRARAARRQW